MIQWLVNMAGWNVPHLAGIWDSISHGYALFSGLGGWVPGWWEW